MSLGREDIVQFMLIEMVVKIEQQIEVLAGLAEKEALHSVLQLHGAHVVHGRITATRAGVSI